MPNQTGMFNVPQIQARLAGMSQQQLFQEGQANQNDALMFSLVNNENMNRQKAKAALMAQQAGQQQPPVKQQDLMAMAPQPNQVPSVPTNMGAGIPLQGPGSPQQMGQNQLPEEQGIGALPANNLQSMAGGGITGYDGGGTTLSSTDVFNSALNMEGVQDPVKRAFLHSIYGQESSSGKNTATSNRGAVGGMQITPIAWQDIPNKDLNHKSDFDQLRGGIRYGLKGFDLANGNPQLAGAYYYGGPPGLNAAMQGKSLKDTKNPNAPDTLSYGKQIADRMTKLLPIGSAQAETMPAQAPAQAPVSLASMIPGQNVQAPAYVAPQKSVFGNIADKLGISEENQMNAGNFATALSGATGAAFIPSYLPRVGLGIAGLGERIYNKFVPETGAIGQKSIADLQAANKAAQIEKGVQGAQEAGSTLEEQDHIRKMMEASQKAQTPSKALELQNAANVRQATEAARMLEGANAARTAAAGTAGVADLSNAMAQPSSATSPTGANTAAQTQDMEDAEDPGFGRGVPAPQNAPARLDSGIDAENGPQANFQSSASAPAPAKGGRDWNNFLLNMGLGLLAGKSPYALQNAGEAGLNALRQEQESKLQDLKERQVAAEERKATIDENKAAAEAGFYKQHGAYFQSMADLYNRGGKDRNTQLAVDQLIEKELAGNKMLFDPAAKNAERIRLQNMYYPHYGLDSTIPKVGGGVDPLGLRTVG